jgi:methylglutaconyl-CoA hydratase
MSVLLEHEPLSGVVQFTLNRPRERNGLSDELVSVLRQRLLHHAARGETRVIVLRAAGAAFCCGAELSKTQELGAGPLAVNQAEARELLALLTDLNDFPKPTVAAVQGPALGLGVGLVCVCDVAIGAEESKFCLSEIRLGLAPALTAPWLIRAIGERQFRRYALSGEMMSAQRAMEIGLLHEVVAASALGGEALRLAIELAQGGPTALTECKRLARRYGSAPHQSASDQDLVDLYAQLRSSSESQEGVAAMMARRPPPWSPT